MQRLEVSGAIRPIYGSLGVKRLIMTSHGMEWTTFGSIPGRNKSFLMPPKRFSCLHIQSILRVVPPPGGGGKSDHSFPPSAENMNKWM